MTMYMVSTLEMRAGKDRERFVAAMHDVVATVEGEGWKLLTAIEQITGRLHTAIDVWELPDLESFTRGLGALRGHPRFPDIGAALAESIERETVVLGARAPWVPDGR